MGADNGYSLPVRRLRLIFSYRFLSALLTRPRPVHRAFGPDHWSILWSFLIDLLLNDVYLVAPCRVASPANSGPPSTSTISVPPQATKSSIASKHSRSTAVSASTTMSPQSTSTIDSRLHWKLCKTPSVTSLMTRHWPPYFLCD